MKIALYVFRSYLSLRFGIIWQGWCRQIIGGNSLTAAIGCVWLEHEHTVSEVLSWQVQLKKAPVLFCTAVKHLTVPHESWVPRSADTTLLNHSTVRGYLYWPTDHYTQETGPRWSKSSCRAPTDSDGCDFSAKHCTLFDFFSTFFLVVQVVYRVFQCWSGLPSPL